MKRDLPWKSNEQQRRRWRERLPGCFLLSVDRHLPATLISLLYRVFTATADRPLASRVLSCVNVIIRSLPLWPLPTSLFFPLAPAEWSCSVFIIPVATTTSLLSSADDFSCLFVPSSPPAFRSLKVFHPRWQEGFEFPMQSRAAGILVEGCLSLSSGT